MKIVDLASYLKGGPVPTPANNQKSDYDIGRGAREPDIGGLRTTKAQTSLHICAV